MFRLGGVSALLGGQPHPWQGGTQWASMEQEVLWPWFYLQMVSAKPGGNLRSMLLVSSADQLENLTEVTSKDLWVEAAFLVTPSFLNNSGTWLMEPLIGVTKVYGQTEKVCAIVYRVESGAEYRVGDCVREDKNTSVVEVFSAERMLGPAHLKGGNK